MSSPFRNDKRCRYSYLDIRPSISFLTEDFFPFSKRQELSLFVFEYTSFNLCPNLRCPPLFETTRGIAIQIQICVLQSLSKLKMPSLFWNDKRYHYLYSIIRPLIPVLTEDVLLLSKRQVVSLFVFEYTSFNIFPNWRCTPLFETTSGVAICIRVYVERVHISADGVVERWDWTDKTRFIYEPFRTVTA